MPRFRLTLERRKNMAGYFFVSPLIVGATLFFLYPLVQSIVFSLNKLSVTPSGYQLSFVGLGNYREALLVNATFPRVLTSTLAKTLSGIPIILVFSFFAASILNQKFRGRLAARLVFFLPVILTSGAIEFATKNDYMHGLAATAATDSQTALLGGAAGFLMQLKLPDGLLQYVAQAVSQIPTIINASGIPIIIFLAGLQTISPSLYEAADIEGATGWERFWIITFPLVSPLLLTNIVYIIVDSFTSPSNEVMSFILDGAWGQLGFGQSTAMAWLYFGIVFVVIAVSIGIISPRVFYQE